MSNQKNNASRNDTGIKVLCIAIAVIFLAFTIYEAITIFSDVSKAFNGFENVLSSILVLVYGLAGVAIGIIGFVLKGEDARKLIVLILIVLAITFAVVTICTTISYIISGFLIGDVVTLAANVAMIVALVLFLVKKKEGKYLLAIPVATLVLHLFNMIVVYPSYSSSTTSYYIWSILMVVFAILVGLYFVLGKRLYMLLGMGVFAFSNLFRMLLMIGSGTSALVPLSSFVLFFGDIMFIMCVALLVAGGKATQSK